MLVSLMFTKQETYFDSSRPAHLAAPRGLPTIHHDDRGAVALTDVVCDVVVR